MSDMNLRLAMGCEQLGGTDWGDVDGGAAMAAVQYAWDHGVRSFDTADVYGLGLSERRLARALGRHRHRARIITKFGVRWESGSGRAATWKDASPAYVEKALEMSLRRLGVDCIPVYLIHWPDSNTALEDTAAALQTARDAGKIGSFGVSNHRDADLRKAAELGGTMLEATFSLIDQTSTTDMKFAHQAGMEVAVYGVLAQGLLTGTYGPHHQFEQSDRRRRLAHFSPEAWRRHAPIRERVAILAKEHATTPSQVALQWALSKEEVTTAIVGVRNQVQISSTLAGLEHQLPVDKLKLLDSETERR